MALQTKTPRLARQLRDRGEQILPAHVRGVFERACALWDRHHYDKAVRLFRQAAREGDAGSILNMGYAYDLGRGVRRSRARAMFWYRKGLELGDPDAAANIGTIYRDEGKPHEALRWFRKAIRLGTADSWLEIAKLYAGPLKNIAAAKGALHSLIRSKALVAESSIEQGARLLSNLNRRET
jgi:TPR repeat protein